MENLWDSCVVEKSYILFGDEELGNIIRDYVDREDNLLERLKRKFLPQYPIENKKIQNVLMEVLNYIPKDINKIIMDYTNAITIITYVPKLDVYIIGVIIKQEHIVINIYRKYDRKLNKWMNKLVLHILKKKGHKYDQEEILKMCSFDLEIGIIVYNKMHMYLENRKNIEYELKKQIDYISLCHKKREYDKAHIVELKNIKVDIFYVKNEIIKAEKWIRNVSAVNFINTTTEQLVISFNKEIQKEKEQIVIIDKSVIYNEVIALMYIIEFNKLADIIKEMTIIENALGV